METTITRKALPAAIKASAGQFTARITTASLDRDGEVLVPAGCNSKEYERNPIVFWNHDPNLPIGRCVGFQREADAIVATTEFARRPEGYVGDFFPDFARAMVEQNIVKGVSVGFLPVDGGYRSATMNDRDRYGAGVRGVYSKWRLLEYSIAPLQSNPDALITAVGKGLVTRAQCKAWLNVDVPEAPPIVVAVPERKATERKRITVELAADKALDDTIRKMIEAEFKKRRGRIHDS